MRLILPATVLLQCHFVEFIHAHAYMCVLQIKLKICASDLMSKREREREIAVRKQLKVCILNNFLQNLTTNFNGHFPGRYSSVRSSV